MSDDYYAVTPETRKAADATIASVISTALKPLGYKKDANTWRKSHPETVHVVNIQKSNGGARFYINLGVLIRAIQDIEKPKEYECHVRARLDARPDDADREDTVSTLIYNNHRSEEWRAEIFSRMLAERALPFLNRFASAADTEAALRSLPLEVALMYNPGAFMHFNIPIPENAFR